MMPPILEIKFIFFLKFLENIKNFCIKAPDIINGIANPNEYKLSKTTALLKVSSIAARVNIEPKIGPMQGVQPKPNARPIKYGKKILLVFFASKRFSKFKKFRFNIPINWREKIMIIKPATILKTSEFCKNIWPITDAVAPKRINTVEKPRQNKISGFKLFFFWLIISCKDCPDTKEIYPGINGKTHGDKKLIKPAPIAMKYSVI